MPLHPQGSSHAMLGTDIRASDGDDGIAVQASKIIIPIVGVDGVSTVGTPLHYRQK